MITVFSVVESALAKHKTSLTETDAESQGFGQRVVFVLESSTG